jgi:ubiquinone/menaquinone biosynthesis C-methylase UbiE
MEINSKAKRVNLYERRYYYAYIKNLLKRKIIGTQGEWESHIDNILHIFNKNLKNYHPENMLDVGCGNGSRTVRIADYFEIQMNNTYGVDFEDHYVLDSRQRFNAIKVDLETNDLPFENDTFDLVVCNQVLEHLKEYKKVIENIIRVTRKNGCIVLGIPNLAHLINRIYLLCGIQPMCISIDGQHVRGFTHKAFHKMLNTFEGIELMDDAGALMYPIPVYLSKHLARYFIGLSGYICYLLIKK